jgi:hypothetical protein
MWRKRLKAILLPVILFLSLTVLMGFLLNFLVHTDSFRRYLLLQLSRTTGYELSAEKISLNLDNGIGIRASNFKVCSIEGNEIAGAARIRMNFSLRDLLKGRILPRELTILTPEIHLAAKRDKGLSFSGRGPVLENRTPIYWRHFPGFPWKTLRLFWNQPGLTLKKLNIRLNRKSKRPLLLGTSFWGTALYDGAKTPFSGKGVIQRRWEERFIR